METEIRGASMMAGVTDRAQAIAWYAALRSLEGSYLHTLFYERGPIPYLCTFFFFLCLALLALKQYRVRIEAAALKSDRLLVLNKCQYISISYELFVAVIYATSWDAPSRRSILPVR